MEWIKKNIKWLLIGLGILIFVRTCICCKERTPQQVQQEYQKVITPQTQEERKVEELIRWPGEVKNQEVVAENIFSRNFLVVLDTSGSMDDRACAGGGDKITVAKKALEIFASSVKDNDNLGLMIFNNGSKLLVPLAPAKNNSADFLQKVSEMKAGGGTYMAEAVRDGFAELTRQGKVQLGYGSYYLVMVTDGQANSGHDPTADINYVIDNTPIMVYGIGFCIKGDHPLNQKGRTIYREASSPEQLTKALADVLAESEQYKDM